MELNIKKIKKEIKRLGLSYQDIADKCKLNSRQQIYYYLKSKSLKGAEIFAKILDIDPKDLIK
ncbi:MAG: hypothetical protein MUO85_03905 [candidate division Zixibacteria bacterium]|nr:hypothetical protein [candidate division Zixibacteria bacterium]